MQHFAVIIQLTAKSCTPMSQPFHIFREKSKIIFLDSEAEPEVSSEEESSEEESD